MSMLKWVAVAIVIVVVGWVVWSQGWVGGMGPASQSGAALNSTTSMSAASDKSDKALVQDTAAIDAQMKGLDGDASAANQADQPVAQSSL